MAEHTREASDHALVAASTGALAGLSVLATPDLKADLSVPVLAIANALDTGIGTALGGKSLSDMGLSKLAELAGSLSEVLGESMGDIVADVASMVPFVGALFSAAIKIFNAFGNVPSPAEKCQRYFAAFAPKPSGSILAGGGGQPFVPADYFARVINVRTAGPLGDQAAWPSVRFVPSDGLFRSALGMGLMAVTEGAPIDPNDLSDADWLSGTSPALNAGPGPYVADLLKYEVAKARGKHWTTTGKTYEEQYKDLLAHTFTLPPNQLPKGLANAKKLIWQRYVDNNYRMWTILWRNGFDPVMTLSSSDPKKDPGRAKRGLPRKWRLRFRALRRGIEASYQKPGDGGALLWVLYVDLLNQAFERGYLSELFVEHLIYHCCEFTAGGTLGLCGPYLAKSIEAIASNWRHTIRPYYDQGAAKLAELTTRLGTEGAPAAPPAAGPTPPTAAPSKAAQPATTPSAMQPATTPSAAPLLAAGLGLLGGCALLLHLVGGRRGYPIAHQTTLHGPGVTR